MSAFGGIYNFNRAPVDEALLQWLGSRLNSRGPDGGLEVVLTSVGMVYRAFHTNEDSRRENQPLVSENNHLLAWNGRLDNREELIAMLDDDLKGNQEDVSIAMAVYFRWGELFPRRLIGDFALSLWDPRSKTLLLARDPIGPRTLYYHSNKDRIIWSTELPALLSLPEIELQINEEYIADLQTRLPDPSQTPYKNIHAVPPGHVVSVSSQRLQTIRFWGLDPRCEIRYKRDAEYEEHFLDLFRQAVRCRLRNDGSTWAELSGGLDSSSIVCMAHDIISNGSVSTSGLETVSHVFDSGQLSDERSSILSMEAMIGKRGHHLEEDNYPILETPARADVFTTPNPFANFSAYYRGLNTVMRNKNGRVLLSGRGGDEILGCAADPSPELTDLLLQLRPLRLHTKVCAWSEALHKSYRHTLWRKAILPTLPRGLRRMFKRTPKDRVLSLYGKQFVTRMNMNERRRGPADDFHFNTRTGRSQSKWFARIVRELASGFGRELCQADITYPFTHRPLVEFMHAIPFEQKVRPGEARSLLRRSMHEVLPGEILNRKRKILNTEAAVRAVRREWGRLALLFTDARICKREFVNPKILSSIFERASEDVDPGCLSILYLVPLEYWLRSFEKGDFKEAIQEPYMHWPLTQSSLEPEYVSHL